MRKFDYSFLDNGLLPADLINLIGSIYSLKTASYIRKEEHIKAFTELETIAKIQSVKNSNEIEGIVSTDERIELIVKGSVSPKDHNEREIAGYSEALNLIHTQYNSLQFSESEILHLHEILFQYTADSRRGKYKESDNVIIEVDALGNRSVRFKPISALETKTAMEQLELAYLDACSNSHINQLLLIPCVILDFLCIHPFTDGNGRMSRLLSLLLLYKNGFDVGKYISFEQQINQQKAWYYESLKKSSYKWDVNENDYSPFIQNFLTTLYMCYHELDNRFGIIEGKHISKKERIEKIIFNSVTPLSKSEICKIVPDVSPYTVERVLASMINENKIIKIGTTRNAKYIRK